MSTIAELVVLLKEKDLFCRVPEDDLVKLLQAGTELTYPAGARIIHQDDLNDCLYVIVNGRVEIDIEDVTKITTRGPGHVVGEMSMISEAPRSANCDAVTEVTVLQISHAIFRRYMETMPGLAVGLLYETVRHLDDTIDELYRMSRQIRNLENLLENATAKSKKV